ncbi:unnamed protein product [Rotaria sp. Silwood1]|nr:unnamed protein product [Rotaria sp. Silwood1]
MSTSMKDSTSPIEMKVYENKPASNTKTGGNFCNRRKIFQNELKEIVSFHPKEWISAFHFNSSYPLFVKGDIDGFMALFINNLATLLTAILCLQPILGNDIVYGKIKRERDQSNKGFQDWPFLTVQLWGEVPHGQWKLQIVNTGGGSGK